MFHLRNHVISFLFISNGKELSVPHHFFLFIWALDICPVPFKFSKMVALSVTALFIAGLQFYASEKTLHAAFESFGELIEGKELNLLFMI